MPRQSKDWLVRQEEFSTQQQLLFAPSSKVPGKVTAQAQGASAFSLPKPRLAALGVRAGGGGGGLEEKVADRQPAPRQLPTDRGSRHQIHSPLHRLGRLTECGAPLPKCPRHLLLCMVQQDTASATQDRGCRPPWRRSRGLRTSFRAVCEEHAPRAPGRQERGRCHLLFSNLGGR